MLSFSTRWRKSHICGGHSIPFSCNNHRPAPQWECGAGWQDCNSGSKEAVLERRFALLQAPPLGPAQPQHQGRPKPSGEAAEHQSLPAHWESLAGSAQVHSTCIITIDEGWVISLAGGPQWVLQCDWGALEEQKIDGVFWWATLSESKLSTDM